MTRHQNVFHERGVSKFVLERGTGRYRRQRAQTSPFRLREVNASSEVFSTLSQFDKRKSITDENNRVGLVNRERERWVRLRCTNTNVLMNGSSLTTGWKLPQLHSAESHRKLVSKINLRAGKLKNLPVILSHSCQKFRGY